MQTLEEITRELEKGRRQIDRDRSSLDGWADRIMNQLLNIDYGKHQNQGSNT